MVGVLDMHTLQKVTLEMENNMSVNEMYVLVLWPESQELMDKEWFDTEAVLVSVDNFDHTLAKESAAYFVPIKYIDDKITFIKDSK